MPLLRYRISSETDRQLETSSKKNDIFTLIFRLRGGLQRINFGLLQEALYNRAFAGTKLQIEEYNRTVIRCLESICDAGVTIKNQRRHMPRQQSAMGSQDKDGLPSSKSTKMRGEIETNGRDGMGIESRTSSENDVGMPISPGAKRGRFDPSAEHGIESEQRPRQSSSKLPQPLQSEKQNQPARIGTMPTEVIPTDVKLAFFNEARHAYGRTALLLSGGAALGFYHVGLIAALLKNNLMPRVISGSSAGSIMAAILGTHTDEELLRMVSTGNGFRNDFIRPDAATVANPIFKFFLAGRNVADTPHLMRRKHSSMVMLTSKRHTCDGGKTISSTTKAKVARLASIGTVVKTVALLPRGMTKKSLMKITTMVASALH